MITESEIHSRHASPGLGNQTPSRTESTRRAAQIYAEYCRHNLRRQLDWRWQRAGDLLKDFEEPDPVYDDGWTRRAYLYRQLADNAGDTLAHTMPDLHAAYQLNAAGGVTRWELEARILSCEAPQDIETKTGIGAPVVECYEKTFFNVLSRIKVVACIMEQAIEQQPLDGRNVAAIWNHFAYRFGPVCLDLIIADFRETGKSDYTHLRNDRGWWRGRSRMQRMFDRSIALLMFEAGSRNFIALLRVHLALMALEQHRESRRRSHERTVLDRLRDQSNGGLDGGTCGLSTGGLWSRHRVGAGEVVWHITMTLEYRNGRPVYYRNKRHNGKVIRHYVASGSMALLAAEQDAHRRAQQLARRLAEEELQMAYVEAREKLHNIAGQVETLTRAMLIDAGYHQRNRGPWRRRMK